MSYIGATIRTAMAAENITQDMLAKGLGINQSGVNRICTGKRIPDRETFDRILKNIPVRHHPALIEGYILDQLPVSARDEIKLVLQCQDPQATYNIPKDPELEETLRKLRRAAINHPAWREVLDGLAELVPSI